SANLLLLLLERAREAGPGSPEACLGFCQLASALTGHLLGRLFDEEEAALWHAQTECLRGNAERVRGDFEAARAAFGRAAAWLALTPGRTLEGAELCRGRGLLLWEQGRLDEAEGLLRQSSRILAEAGPPDEEGAARVLLGLLAAERGDRGRAARLLEAGRAALDPERWPWLALHARLGLALEYARRGQAQRAEALLDPQPVEEEGPDTGLLRAWLEGQVRLRIGQPAEGEKRLREAWCGFLARDDGPRAALCALDLAAALVRQGRGGEVGTLVDALREGCRGDPALEAFCAGPRNAMTAGELDRLTQEEGLTEAVARARRVLRSRGYGVLLAV
ncbi:MAG TPA: hypothetical protein VL025_03755, partial [Thermoanaerobaculia bacterium]|nr:hypothetical protein [Thermoanaerobaculia bacterium]